MTALSQFTMREDNSEIFCNLFSVVLHIETCPRFERSRLACWFRAPTAGGGIVLIVDGQQRLRLRIPRIASVSRD
jgi:hypothetical protein